MQDLEFFLFLSEKGERNVSVCFSFSLEKWQRNVHFWILFFFLPMKGERKKEICHGEFDFSFPGRSKADEIS